MGLRSLLGLDATQRPAKPANPPSGRRLLYAKSDGWYDLDPAGVESKLQSSGSHTHTSHQGTGNIKVFYNLLAHRHAASATTGSLVITTPITFNNYMCRVDLQGFNYDSSEEEISAVVSFYATTTPSFTRTNFSTSGNRTLTCRLGRNASSQVVIIIDNPHNIWEWTLVDIPRVIGGHTLPPDSWSSGWSATFTTDLTPYTIMDTPLLRDSYTDITSLKARKINSGTALTGGGDLTADRTLAVDFAASGTSSTTKATRADDSRLSDKRVPTDTATAALRVPTNLTGGGTITVTSGNAVSWSQRFITISNGNGSHFSTNGFFNIDMPPDGTVITGVGGVGNVTVSGGTISVGAWVGLYYILPVGSGSGSVAGNFRLVSYTSALVVPETWVLVCIRTESGWRWGNGALMQGPNIASTWTMANPFPQYSLTSHTHAEAKDYYAALPTLAYCAHRMNPNIFPEASLEAAEMSTAVGVDCLEVDVHETTDGALVCHHDTTTSRLMTTNVTINEQNTVAVKGLKFNDASLPLGWAGRTVRPILLDDLLRAYGDKVLISVEPKTQAAGDLLPTVLNRWIKNKANIIVPSTTPAYQTPAQNAGYRIVRRDTDPVAVLAAGCTHVNAQLSSLNTSTVSNLKANGIKVWAWTINTQADRDLAISYGVDGIISDDTGYVSKAKRRTVDPFEAQTQYHGHLSGGARNGGEPLGRFRSPDWFGFDNYQGVSNCESAVLQGWACPIKDNPTTKSFTLTFTAEMVNLQSQSNAANFSVACGPSDNRPFGGHMAVGTTFDGWFAVFEADGWVRVRNANGAGGYTDIASQQLTNRFDNGTNRTVTITVTSTSVRVQVGSVDLTANFTVPGSGYLWFGAGGTETYFKNVSIA